MGETWTPGRLWITDAILEALRGDSFALHAYLGLARHANAAGVCWPTQARLMTVTGLTRRTLQMALDRLEKVLGPEGFAREPRGRGTTYQLPLTTRSKGAPPAPDRRTTCAIKAHHVRTKEFSGRNIQEGSGGNPEPSPSKPPRKPEYVAAVRNFLPLIGRRVIDPLQARADARQEAEEARRRVLRAQLATLEAGFKR